jgi:hypothetical protein
VTLSSILPIGSDFHNEKHFFCFPLLAFLTFFFIGEQKWTGDKDRLDHTAKQWHRINPTEAPSIKRWTCDLLAKHGLPSLNYENLTFIVKNISNRSSRW